MSSFLYVDRPSEASGRAELSNIQLSKQEYAEDILFFNESIPNGYQNWASFEQGEFDFNKPLFQFDPESKIPYATNELTAVGVYPHIDVYLDEPYSAGGITVKTYFKSYTIRIAAVTSSGTVSKTFRKSATSYTDEFFPIAFDNATKILINFEDLPKNHFFKIIGVSVGGVRFLTEADFVENPTIETNFSLTNEECAFDILSMTIRGGKEDFNFIAGELITEESTGKRFYVDSANLNTNGTIDVTCYDRLAVLEEIPFLGLMRTASPVEGDGLITTAPYELRSTLVSGQTYSGTISSDVSRREALRMFLQGNALCLKRENDTFVYFTPYNENGFEPVVEFDITDICSEPELEILDKLTRIHFSKHKYNVDTSQGKVEAFRDNVERNVETVISYSEPYTSTGVFYDNNGTLVPVSNSEILGSGAYFKKLKNTHSQEIVVTGYPYKVSYTAIESIPNISRQFKENEMMISDCSVSLDGNIGKFRNYLAEIYKFNKIVSFDSLKEAIAGDYVSVSYDGNSFVGWITRKIDNLTGVYHYEVLCV